MYLILNFFYFHLSFSKSIILPDYLTLNLAFEKRLINVWPTLATFNRRWANVYLHFFNVLLVTLDKLSKNDVPQTFTQRKNVETTFLKRFCTSWETIFQFSYYQVNKGLTVEKANYQKREIMKHLKALL